MYLYLEARGHFLRFGKLDPPKPPTDPVPVGTSTPMTTVGFMPRRGYRTGGTINPQMQDQKEVQT